MYPDRLVPQIVILKSATSRKYPFCDFDFDNDGQSHGLKVYGTTVQYFVNFNRRIPNPRRSSHRNAPVHPLAKSEDSNLKHRVPEYLAVRLGYDFIISGFQIKDYHISLFA